MNSPSGKFVLRISPDLHSALRSAAKSNRVSLNEWIVKLLTGDRGPSPAPALARLKGEFQDGLIGVVQFGSSIRGEMRKDSDVDLLIVLSDSRPVDRSLYSIWDKLCGEKDFQIFSPQFSHIPAEKVSSLWLEVALEGEILLDTEHRVAKKLNEIRHRIASGEFVRKLSHGHPYWVRKEVQSAE